VGIHKTRGYSYHCDTGSKESWLRLNYAFHFNGQSDSSLKRIIPEPSVPSRGSQARGTRLLYYKTNIKYFSVLIYSYINNRGNWENSKLCETTPPFGRRVSTQFLVFPISTRVDITVYYINTENVLYLLTIKLKISTKIRLSMML
jgi:hypothetical protein